MIRPFRLRDAVRLHRLAKHSTSLHLERRLTNPHSPVAAALGAPLPWAGTGAATFLSISDAAAGFIQASKRFGRPEADILCIAPAHNAHSRAPDLWQRLLASVIVGAGEHGIHRLYLCLDSDDAALLTVTQSGFAPYVQETLFRHPGVSSLQHPSAKPWAGVRPQNESDGFAIQRLYSHCTPPVVQVAEGAPVNPPEPSSPLHLLVWWQPEHIEGFVYESQGEILAVAHIRRGQRGHWLRFIGIPDADEIIATLLARCLHALTHYSARPIYCALRPHQRHFSPLLTDAGFASGLTLTRLVKHTTVPVRESTPVSARESVEMTALIPEIRLNPASKKETSGSH